MKKYKIVIIIVIIALCAFLLDLGTKQFFNNTMDPYQSREIIDGFFYFTLCYNTGGAWSIMSGNTWILVIISIIALGAVIYSMIKVNDKFYRYCSAVFIGGLIGNLFDRIMFGKVIDFLDFVIFGYDFPVFNLADSFICVGAFLMFIAIIKEEKKNERANISNN